MKSTFVSSVLTLTVLSLGASAAPCELEAVRLVEMNQVTKDAKTTTTLGIAVSSSGCTSEKDFKIESRQIGNARSLRVVRIHRDDCKAMPRETTIRIETNELESGIRHPITIENPILPNDSFYEPGALLPLN